MAEYQVGFKIISDFDSRGCKEAKTGLAEVTQAANANAAGSVQAASAAGQMQEGLKGIKTQARGAGAAVGGLATLLGEGNGGLKGALRGFGSIAGAIAMGPVAVLIAGVAALVMTYKNAKAAVLEAEKAFQDQAIVMQKTRLDNIISQHQRLTEQLQQEAKAHEDLAQASAKLVAAQASTKIAAMEGRAEQEVASQKNPEDKEKKALEWAKKIAEVQAQASRDQAEMADKLAQDKLSAARREQAEAERSVKKLQDEYYRSSLKTEIAKDLEKAKDEKQTKDDAVNSASVNYESANEALATVKIEQVNAEQKALQHILDYNHTLLLKAQAEEADLAYAKDEQDMREIQKDLQKKTNEDHEEAEKLAKKYLESEKDAVNAVQEKAKHDLELAKKAQEQAKLMTATQQHAEKQTERENARNMAKKDRADDLRAKRLERESKGGSHVSQNNRDWYADYQKNRQDRNGNNVNAAQQAVDYHAKSLRKLDEQITAMNGYTTAVLKMLTAQN